MRPDPGHTGFLMHRVELKARRIDGEARPVLPAKFLMHRVELKVMWYDDASKEPKLFLMHRVELKVKCFTTRE